MSSADWTPEPRDEIPELDTNYEPTRYEQVMWATVQDKLDHASLDILRQIMRSGIGEPDAHT